MKVVILAGGYGTRISEESYLRPKPMIDIGGKPILWHIMKIFSSFGFNEFIICAGYKQEVIKEYFDNYYINSCDVTFDFASSTKTIHNNATEAWKVTVVNTGIDTMTGGRLKRIKDYIGNEPFFITYGDGVSNVNIKSLLAFHNKNKKILTITAIQPEGRFGIISFGKDDEIKAFREKSKDDTGWINGGFMVAEPTLFDYVEGDKTVFEKEPFEKLVANNQIDAYKHDGFWQCMDTMRDKEKLEGMWATNKAPWKLWKK